MFKYEEQDNTDLLIIGFVLLNEIVRNSIGKSRHANLKLPYFCVPIKKARERTKNLSLLSDRAN